ncbi:MAG: glycosyltransferase, partial [Archaeoglobaceae archaeon]|nr:glycosyltransferase [Archaeoglobaceae archaeon]
MEVIFIVFSTIIFLYVVRHLIFTLAVLCKKQQKKQHSYGCYYPSVTVLIPARNEEKVIGRILRRMAELTYPKEKLQVIVIDDGSEDKTGAIAGLFADQYDFIGVIHRSPHEGGQGKASV